MGERGWCLEERRLLEGEREWGRRCFREGGGDREWGWCLEERRCLERWCLVVGERGRRLVGERERERRCLEGERGWCFLEGERERGRDLGGEREQWERDLGGERERWGGEVRRDFLEGGEGKR